MADKNPTHMLVMDHLGAQGLWSLMCTSSLVIWCEEYEVLMLACMRLAGPALHKAVLMPACLTLQRGLPCSNSVT